MCVCVCLKDDRAFVSGMKTRMTACLLSVFVNDDCVLTVSWMKMTMTVILMSVCMVHACASFCLMTMMTGALYFFLSV